MIWSALGTGEHELLKGLLNIVTGWLVKTVADSSIQQKLRHGMLRASKVVSHVPARDCTASGRLHESVEFQR